MRRLSAVVIVRKVLRDNYRVFGKAVRGKVENFDLTVRYVLSVQRHFKGVKTLNTPARTMSLVGGVIKNEQNFIVFKLKLNLRVYSK